MYNLVLPKVSHLNGKRKYPDIDDGIEHSIQYDNKIVLSITEPETYDDHIGITFEEICYNSFDKLLQGYIKISCSIGNGKGKEGYLEMRLDKAKRKHEEDLVNQWQRSWKLNDWVKLHNDEKRIPFQDLYMGDFKGEGIGDGLLDFNGNGISDVLRRDGNRFYVSYDGKGDWEYLNYINQKDLRFGFFDGDNHQLKKVKKYQLQVKPLYAPMKENKIAAGEDLPYTEELNQIVMGSNERAIRKLFGKRRPTKITWRYEAVDLMSGKAIKIKAKKRTRAKRKKFTVTCPRSSSVLSNIEINFPKKDKGKFYLFVATATITDTFGNTSTVNYPVYSHFIPMDKYEIQPNFDPTLYQQKLEYYSKDGVLDLMELSGLFKVKEGRLISGNR